MNVNDFNNEVPKGDLLEAVFARQTLLIEKYHDVETRNIGIDLPTIPYDLNDRRVQYRIKDFAWRITEELTEATECISNPDNTHFLEELIDAMHFYIELLIYLGVTPEMLAVAVSSDTEHEAVPTDLMHRMFFCLGRPTLRRTLAFDVIEAIGLAMNCLKNKPWKQTHMITDRRQFLTHLYAGFKHFVVLLKAAGYSHDTATLMYLNKNDVNQFRIRSQY